MQNFHSRLAAITGLLLLPGTAVLAQDSAGTSGGSTELETVVLTATRSSQDIDKVLSSVTVITAADIEQLQARNIIDLLAGQAGITINNTGGEGKLTSVFMRGTSADHVLVLLNGMRFASTTAGTASLQDIPVNQVERIEIVRGPRASLYGSDAIGGVIQIFTREPQEGLQFKADATAGSYGRREFGIGVGERFGENWYRFDAGHKSMEGFDACENDTSSGCFANEPDDDGYDNTSVSARFGHAFDEDSEMELDLLHSSGETEFDGFTNRTEYARGAYNLRGRFGIGDDWTAGFRGGRSFDDADNSGPFGNGYIDTRRDELSLQADYKLASGLLSFGTDMREDSLESSTAYDATSRDTLAGFTQLQWELENWRLEAALRYTDNEQFGSRDTGSIAIGHDFDANWTGWISNGSAFHAPTFNDLYFPGFSNPELRPEVSHSTEAGLRRDTTQQHFEFSVYRTRLSNLIEFDFASMMPVNVSVAEIHGVELGWRGRFDWWTLAANATFLDTENMSAANNGNELPRRAGEILRIDIDRDFQSWRLGLGLLAESGRYDDLANSTRLPGYGLVDLRASWTLDSEWELAARIGNLLDRDYQTVAGYHQAGRNAQLTLRYRY